MMDFGCKILVVDDVLENIQVVMNILKEESCELSFATDGESALNLIRNEHFDMVLLDIMMPGMDGLEVCRRMRTEKALEDIPVIFLTAKTDIDSITEGFKVGGMDYIIKPFHASELLSRVRTHLELYRSRLLLRHMNVSLETKMQFRESRLLSELESSQKELIYLLMELMEATSDETGKHIRRVAEYTRLLAHYHPSISETDAELLFHAAPMHDIGKIIIPHHILHKPGRLTPEEFEVMKTHTSRAHEFFRISQRKVIRMADTIAYEHHEKWDGSGYPRALKGDEIHIYGRIVALADTFDALTHKRVYKEAWSIDDSINYIYENSGKHFDPELVAIFREHIDEFISISHL